jgi:hypothetical protein
MRDCLVTQHDHFTFHSKPFASLTTRMRPCIFSALPSFGRVPARAIMTYAPGHLLRGNVWDYRILATVGGDGTHGSTIFKAEIVPRENITTANVPKWSVMLPRVHMSSEL